MFIEFHDGETNNRVLVNADDISVVADLPDVEEKTMLVLRGGLDTWRYVREPYDEIKMMLTDRLIARNSRKESVKCSQRSF